MRRSKHKYLVQLIIRLNLAKNFAFQEGLATAVVYVSLPVRQSQIESDYNHTQCFFRLRLIPAPANCVCALELQPQV